MTLKISKFLFLFSCLLLCTSANAAGSGHHDLNYIPWGKIASHAFNLSVLVGGLFFLLRNQAKNMFTQRLSAYNEQARKTEEARQKAQQENQEIKIKLNKLESTEDETLKRAQQEAAELKKSIISEALVNSKRIETEAQNAASDELRRAKNLIRLQLISESLKSSKEQLKTQITPQTDTQLQQAFIKQVGVN